MASCIIGIDPGSSGGIAWIDPEGEVHATKYDGKTEADVALILSDISNGAFVYIERVGPNRNRANGDRAQGASSMFTFGQNYGFWRGLLVAYRIPFEEVTPQKWLPAMGLRGIAGETQTQKKNRHKAKAQQLFPQLKITLMTADALLLAEYGRRVRVAENGVQ